MAGVKKDDKLPAVPSMCERMILSIIASHPGKHFNEDGKDIGLNTFDILEYLEKDFDTIYVFQTVSTFLTRLKKKGYISQVRIGRYSFYQLTKSFDTLIDEELDQLAYLYFNGKKSTLYKYLKQKYT